MAKMCDKCDINDKETNVKVKTFEFGVKLVDVGHAGCIEQRDLCPKCENDFRTLMRGFCPMPIQTDVDPF